MKFCTIIQWRHLKYTMNICPVDTNVIIRATSRLYTVTATEILRIKRSIAMQFNIRSSY